MILLTGGKGFIGSHVLLELLKNYKDQIVVADLETYAARPPLYVNKSDRVIFEKVDIRDQLAVRRMYEKHKPRITVHMAAESHVCRSITGPKDFATTNIMGTFNLLEEHRAIKADRFLHVSTDEVYGEIKTGKFSEDSPYAPRSPYASTKAASDLIAKSYCTTYDIDVVVVNMSNNFGPNQHPEKLVPRTILHILQDKPVIVHGKGNHVRDWLYVKDAAAGIIAALENGTAGESYCLGGDMELTNLEMIKKIHEALARLQPTVGKLQIKHTNDRPTDDFRYALDTTKASKEIDWIPSPEYFTQNLEATVQWYIHAILHSGGGALHGRGA